MREHLEEALNPRNYEARMMQPDPDADPGPHTTGTRARLASALLAARATARGAGPDVSAEIDARAARRGLLPAGHDPARRHVVGLITATGTARLLQNASSIADLLRGSATQCVPTLPAATGPAEGQMFEHVTVMTPRLSFTMDAATLTRLAEEARRRLQAAFPDASLLLHDDGSTIWAGIRTLPAGWPLSPATVYWPAVHATREAVLAVAGDGRAALGHEGPCETLPPPLLLSTGR